MDFFSIKVSSLLTHTNLEVWQKFWDFWDKLKKGESALSSRTFCFLAAAGRCLRQLLQSRISEGYVLAFLKMMGERSKMVLYFFAALTFTTLSVIHSISAARSLLKPPDVASERIANFGKANALWQVCVVIGMRR